MKKVIHFELPYLDAHRAAHFYSHIFGWDINKADVSGMEYSVIHTGPTDDKNMVTEPGFINGGMMPKNDLIKGPVIAILVDNIEETIGMIEDHGGKKLLEPMEVGDMGRYIYAEDSEGNIIGLWENKK